jgi:protein gp37
MAENTAIAWTDHTWNPWMGCHKVSDGCKHCYAEVLVKGRMGRPGMWGLTGTRERTSDAYWRRPRRWNVLAEEAQVPLRIFCASLADVFEDYGTPDAPGPNQWRDDVFDIIRATPWLDWQLLTKRPENIARMVPDDWSLETFPNVWLGTSIEDNRVGHRAAELIKVEASVHFVSYEPAVGPLTPPDMSLYDIEWVIVGGESGPGYRQMDLEWARDMQRWCRLTGTTFFFKQDSAPRTEMGIDALGQVYRDYPLTWNRKHGDFRALERFIPTRVAA